jgi:Transcription termination factor nusG
MAMLDETTGCGYAATERTAHQPGPTVRRSCGRLPWFCIQTVPGMAFQAETALAADGFPIYHPLHLHRVPGRAPRIVPLFPNYLFTAFDPTDTDWPRICHTRWVRGLLGTPGHPAPVPAGVIEALQARTSDRRVVDDPLAPEAWRNIPVGASVSVVDGPLTGLRGICQLSAPERCSVLLSLFGREVVMDLPPQALAVA